MRNYIKMLLDANCLKMHERFAIKGLEKKGLFFFDEAFELRAENGRKSNHVLHCLLTGEYQITTGF